MAWVLTNFAILVVLLAFTIAVAGPLALVRRILRTRGPAGDLASLDVTGPDPRSGIAPRRLWAFTSLVLLGVVLRLLGSSRLVMPGPPPEDLAGVKALLPWVRDLSHQALAGLGPGPLGLILIGSGLLIAALEFSARRVARSGFTPLGRAPSRETLLQAADAGLARGRTDAPRATWLDRHDADADLGSRASQDCAEGELPVAFLAVVAVVLFVLLFAAAVIENRFYQTAYLDFGWFEQAEYLISRGDNPIISIVGVHALGDHFSLILYPLALIFRILPFASTLLAIQALALASGVFPAYLMARDLGLCRKSASIAVLLYAMNPTVANVDLFPFHPDVLALPAFLWAFWSARTKRWPVFLFSVAIILATKDVLAITLAATSLALWAQNRRRHAVIAATAGTGWFLLTFYVFIPRFTPTNWHLDRFSALGSSLTGIATHLLLHPAYLLRAMAAPAFLFYCLAMLLPGLPWLRRTGAWAATGAIPALVFNALAPMQLNLLAQYTIAIFPFFYLWLLESLAARRSRALPRWILPWAAFAFLGLWRGPWIAWHCLEDRPILPALESAVASIPPGASVLTTDEVAAHLAFRRSVHLIDAETGFRPAPGLPYDYVLVDPGLPGKPQIQRATENQLVGQLRLAPDWRILEARRGVWLFRRQLSTPGASDTRGPGGREV